MKKAIVTAALVLMSVSPALASRYDITFHDTLRPNGHRRSLAVANSTANSCYAQTGTSGEEAPTPAFKDCMKTQGFSWVSTKFVRDPPSKHAASAIPKGRFIDQETGLLCHNTDLATICESPPADMTIRYTNKHGLGCTRTGAFSLCSNL